jgi:hypothetical protein
LHRLAGVLRGSRRPDRDVTRMGQAKIPHKRSRVSHKRTARWDDATLCPAPALRCFESISTGMHCVQSRLQRHCVQSSNKDIRRWTLHALRAPVPNVGCVRGKSIQKIIDLPALLGWRTVGDGRRRSIAHEHDEKWRRIQSCLMRKRSCAIQPRVGLAQFPNSIARKSIEPESSELLAQTAT